MQLPYTQQALYRQYYPSTPSHNSVTAGLGYPSRPGVTGSSMTPGFTQRVAPSYNAQTYTNDFNRDQPAISTTGPGYGYNAYGGGSISGYGFNHAMAGCLGVPSPQPLQYSDNSMPNISYSNLRGDEPYYAGYHFGTEQVPCPTMNFSPRLPEADPNQGASHEWRFYTSWVSHAGEDEIHLTIALKKA